jgi:hypothetical protein
MRSSCQTLQGQAKAPENERPQPAGAGLAARVERAYELEGGGE